MVSHVLLCNNECYYQVANDWLLVNKKYKLKWYILTSLFENNSLIRLGISPVQCSAGTPGLSFPWFTPVLQTLAPVFRAHTAIPAGKRGHRRGTWLHHLAFSDWWPSATGEFLPCCVFRAISSAARLVPGVLRRPSPAMLGAISQAAQAGRRDLREKACFSLIPWTQGLLAECYPTTTCFRCSTGKGFHL